MISVVTSAALLALVKSLVGNSDQSPLALIMKRVTSNLLIAWVAIIAASRVYILAHFPHQCFLALLIGLASFEAAFSTRLKWNLWSTGRLVFVSLLLVGSALSVFAKIEDFLMFDVNWSLTLAAKFCLKVFNQIVHVIDILECSCLATTKLFI